MLTPAGARYDVGLERLVAMLSELNRYRTKAERANLRFFDNLGRYVDDLPELIPDTVFLDACERVSVCRLPEVGCDFLTCLMSGLGEIEEQGEPRPREAMTPTPQLAALELLGLARPTYKVVDESRVVTMSDYEYWQVLAGPLVDTAESLADPPPDSLISLLFIAAVLAYRDELFRPAIAALGDPREFGVALRSAIEKSKVNLDPPFESMVLGNRPFSKQVTCFYKKSAMGEVLLAMAWLTGVLVGSGRKIVTNPRKAILASLDKLKKLSSADSAAIRDFLKRYGFVSVATEFEEEAWRDFFPTQKKARFHYRNVMWRWEYQKLMVPDRFDIHDKKPMDPQDALQHLSRNMCLGEPSTVRDRIYDVPKGIFVQHSK